MLDHEECARTAADDSQPKREASLAAPDGYAVAEAVKGLCAAKLELIKCRDSLRLDALMKPHTVSDHPPMQTETHHTEPETVQSPTDRRAELGASACSPEALVNRFQCPGCVCGSSSKDGCLTYSETEMRCTRHVLGTMTYGGGSWALGLPKGFCKPGWKDDGTGSRNKISLRLWADGTHPKWDNFNVAVWALETDGCLFVRTYAPRINFSWVDVIAGGTLSLVPTAINVGAFTEDFD